MPEHHPQVAAAHVLDGNRHLERTTEKSGNERGGVNTGLNIREGVRSAARFILAAHSGQFLTEKINPAPERHPDNNDEDKEEG